MSRQRVCALSEVPAGEVRAFTCGTRSIAIANVDGELHAIDNVCTHDGGPLGDGRLEGSRVLCPRHGAAFDSRSGRALTLPAVRGVRGYQVAVEGDDVYIECGE